LGEIACILILIVLFFNLILIFYYTIVVWAEYGNSDDFRRKYMQFKNVKEEDPFDDDENKKIEEKEKILGETFEMKKSHDVDKDLR